MKSIIILSPHDLVYYPPTQSLICIMLNMGIRVVYIGLFSDTQSRKEFENKGVEFRDLILNEDGNYLEKILRRRKYVNELIKILEELNISKQYLLWYIYSGASVCSLYKLLGKYNYVVHFYEFVGALHSWKYKILYPNYKMSDFLQKAKGVIHCEYNRAQLCKGLYGLDSLPFIIPNKPYIDESKLASPPSDILGTINAVKDKLNNRKVIIYQGFFNAKERRLEEFCQAVELLSEDYALVIMGRGSTYFDKLKSKYESERTIFIPFIRPPYHLLITQKASVGILTYHPMDNTYAGVINPLFCAPNKIYEYGMYGIPMLGNDISGLKYIFNEYHCGVTISHPITPEKIVRSIETIENDFEAYSKGSKDVYDSVNIEKTISEILNTIM